MTENTLFLKSVNELFDYSFFIPSYQRGYRWTTTQVAQLLDDIWQFAINPPKQEENKEKPFYCLQPIVVLKRADKNEQEVIEWEVIDGQQRLTTIFLILKSLEKQIERDQKNIRSIHYETRPESENYLKHIDSELASTNIDFFHIYEADKCIHQWFQDKANTSECASPRAFLSEYFLSRTKVIWYEINDTDTDPVDIFTRINIGKIPLTNAELIKALILQKDNFSDSNIHLKQVQIANEWDLIEKTLQDDRFWYFIYNLGNPLKYENRIEFIFDIKSNKSKENEFYHTFLKFQKQFEDLKLNSVNYLEDFWLLIKKYFLHLEEWYHDYEIYHLIGYLIDCGIAIQDLLDFSSGKTKKAFVNFLKSEVKKQIALKQDSTLEDIDYNSDKKLAKRVLLLFNVLTIIKSNNESYKFPFDKYKLEAWDIEHVRSLTEKEITAEKRKDWVCDIIEFFTGDRNSVMNDIESLNDLEKQYCDRLIDIRDAETVNPEKFDNLYIDIQKHFNEATQPDDINTISNLALLDAKTNRSYKNAMFPIKRNRIIANDKNGKYVPICTKNLFLKYYTQRMDDVMFWRESDARAYVASIKETLEKYLTI